MEPGALIAELPGGQDGRLKKECTPRLRRSSASYVQCRGCPLPCACQVACTQSFRSSAGQSVRLLTSRLGARASQGASYARCAPAVPRGHSSSSSSLPAAEGLCPSISPAEAAFWQPMSCAEKPGPSLCWGLQRPRLHSIHRAPVAALANRTLTLDIACPS